MSKLKLADPKIISLLYQLMYDTHQILTDADIKYWLDSGSFLGVIRHEGIIPWDDDIDIGMLYKDKQSFLKLTRIFKKCGYTIIPFWFGFKIFYTKIKPTEFDYSFPNLDIFLFDEKETKITLHHKKARDTWKNGYYHKDELFPLTLYPFGEISVYAPKKHDDYFNRMYGNDWNKIAYREYDHEKEEEIKKIKVKLTPEMRKPAKPTKVKEKSCVKHHYSPVKSVSWKEKSLKICRRNEPCNNNFNEKMSVYVINCDMHIDRIDKFYTYAKKIGLNACRVPCILGKKFSKDQICKLIKDKILSKNADMTQVEVSINMSHYNCWQKLINSCLDYALIVEDDIEVQPNFIKKINLIMDTLKEKEINFSILHLWNGNWGHTKSKQKSVVKIIDGLEVVKETTDYNAGAAAYIMSKKYAEWLMDRFLPIRMPQDMLMGTYYRHGNHLSLKMKYRREDECYLSPVLDLECGGEGGTGTQTTQTYDAPIVKRIKCC